MLPNSQTVLPNDVRVQRSLWARTPPSYTTTIRNVNYFGENFENVEQIETNFINLQKLDKFLEKYNSLNYFVSFNKNLLSLTYYYKINTF